MTQCAPACPALICRGGRGRGRAHAATAAAPTARAAAPAPVQEWNGCGRGVCVNAAFVLMLHWLGRWHARKRFIKEQHCEVIV
eukprot:352367-Chlamydomonas_euryale.AAC.3